MLPGGSSGRPGRSGAGHSRGGSGDKTPGQPGLAGLAGKAPCRDEPEQRLGQGVRAGDGSAGLVAID